MSDSHEKHAVERDQVAKIINSVVSKVESAETVSRETIFSELKSLQGIINEMRKDLGYTGAGDISATDIPTATDELDAVVEATATATGTIMDVCELIETKCEASTAPETDEIAMEVTKIYEACSFQDITGQRISKVIKTLRTIETKVDSILTVMSDKLPGIQETVAREEVKASVDDEASLLNGPQMADHAISQDDIDSLLDDLFD